MTDNLEQPKETAMNATNWHTTTIKWTPSPTPRQRLDFATGDGTVAAPGRWHFTHLAWPSWEAGEQPQ